ncbi:MAG: hypothetical protein KKC53_00530, partial [Actinobacteria bacterium]|nr:hypothetical protein [Actinomycetota bacterium]
MKIKQILNYIILFVSFILIFGLVLACSEVSTKPEKVEELTEEDTKTDKALAEFQDAYNITFHESVEKHDALNREFSENVRKLNAIDDDKKDLDPKMEFSLLKRKIFKLSQNALDILEEMQEMCKKQKDSINDQSYIISKIQGNVVKIT